MNAVGATRGLGSAAAVLLLLLGGAKMGTASTLGAAEAQFHKSCGTCHTVEANAPPRQGPNLRDVIGRKAGTLAGFSYSDALKAAGAGGLVWNEQNLDRWITDAGRFIPGVNMMYRQADPGKRRLVIEYLKSLSK
jgi:cytochrome c